MPIISRLCTKIRKEYYKKRGLKAKETKQVSWGVLGLGYMANVFTDTLEAAGEARVVAAASRDLVKATAFAKRHHVERAYGSYQEMLEDNKGKVDIIYIATPQKYHYEHIKMCLEQGYGVLCEKPITSNVEQLRELIALAQDKNLFLMEGMWLKCLPTYRKAKEWVAEGKIGEVVSVQVDLSKNEEVSVGKTTFNQQEGGGVLLDYGIYALTFPLGFMKDSVQIGDFERKNRENGIDAEWDIVLTDGAVQAHITISSKNEGEKKAFIIGTKGKIVFEAQFNRTNKIYLLNEKDKIVETLHSKYIFEGFEYEVAEVNRTILAGKSESELVTLEKSVQALEMVDFLVKR